MPPSPCGSGSGFVKTWGGLTFLKMDRSLLLLIPFPLTQQALGSKFAHILANNCSEQTVCLTLDAL